MKFLLIPQGSSGDVNPFVGIGRELRSRGHEVTIATCDYFEQTIRKAGLDYQKLGTTELYLRLVANPDLWHPRRGSKVIFGDPELRAAVRNTFDLVTDFHKSNPDAVVAAGTLATGARIAHEFQPRLRYASVHLQPGVLRSIVDPAVFGGVRFAPWAPRSLVHGFFWMGDWMVDRWMRPSVAALRKELQLPNQSRYLKDWIHSPQMTIGLFPDWFASAPDWPTHLKLTGFVTEDGEEQLPPGLSDWLAEGDPPVIFTFGSAMAHGHSLFAAAQDSCRRLGRRALFLTKFPEQLPTPLGPHVRHVHYAPLGKIASSGAVLVHHGGVGTTARALQSGRPQIIVPFGHDQFDNAQRVQRLNAGTSLARNRVTGSRLATAIQNCLDSPAMRGACESLAAKFIEQDGAARAADALEDLGVRPAGD